MTFEEYINNPMGSSVVANQREMYKAYYIQKYDALMVRENGKIEYRLYKAKKSDVYAIYLNIPSEKVSDFYYDVVIEFTPKKGIVPKSLNHCDIKVYSNDPSFIYTFAYAFNKDKMFISELAPRMSKQALTDKAKEKNPKALIGYVKTLYFAYLFMNRSGLFNLLRYNGVEELDYKKISKLITSADEKISLRQEASNKKEKSRPSSTRARSSSNNNLFAKTANVVKIGTVSRINKLTPKTKTVKKTKR